MIASTVDRPGLPDSWGASPAERAAALPCDDLLPAAGRVLHRAVTVRAPAELTYRWLCQLRFAPYSYDWLDNRGRRSPRALTPDGDRLAVGQRVMRIFRLTSFTPGEQLTLLLDDPRGRRLFGDVAVTYTVRATGSGCRLVARLRWAGVGALRGRALAWGDLLMMRRQLRTLAGLAARDAAAR